MTFGGIGYKYYSDYSYKMDAFKVLLSDNWNGFQPKCYSSKLGSDPLA